MATGTNNKSNVSVGKPMGNGALYIAPVGTAMPTDVTTPLSEEWLNLGYLHSDGITFTSERESEEIVAYGGDTVLVTGSSYKATASLTFIETLSDTVNKFVYGSKNVTGSIAEAGGLMSVDETGEMPDHWAMVYEFLLTGGIKQRYLVWDGQLTELGDLAYNDTDPIGYESTVTAFRVGDNPYGRRLTYNPGTGDIAKEPIMSD